MNQKDKDTPKEAPKEATGEPPKEESSDEVLSSQKRVIGLSDDTATEFLSKLSELERMDTVFSDSLEIRFQEMQSKLERIEGLRATALNTLIQKLDSIKKEVDSVDFQDLKGDVKEAVQKLLSIKSRIEKLETLIEGTDQKAANLQGLHNTRSTEFQDVVEKSSGWGFWTYFMFLQVFICLGYVWWRNQSSNDRRKHSFD